MNMSTKTGIIAVLAGVAVLNVVSLVNGQTQTAEGQVYEDAISEFMAQNGQIVTMYEVHSDNAVTITSVTDNSGNVLYEDEIGEYLSNAGYDMVEFSPEGGRNGELLIVANPSANVPNTTTSFVNEEIVL